MSEPNNRPAKASGQNVAGLIIRAIASFVVITIYGWTNYLLHPVGMLMTTKLANKQFEDSDVSFLTAYYGMDFFQHLGIPSIVLLIILVLIWLKQLKNGFATMLSVLTLTLIIGAAQFIGTTNVWAFANTTEKAEYRSIEPDETAFLIPNFGASLSNQEQYKPDYLNTGKGPDGKDIKVPGKFIKIPHDKLKDTGGTGMFSGYDYIVNTSTLVKVKRSQFSRVWTAAGRGTRKDVDESFDCQTKDGLNVKKIGVAIIDLIEDQNAALYLSNYGLEPLDPKLAEDNIETIFQSVRKARSLISVTDDVVFTEVHRLVCKYIGEEVDPETASGNINVIMVNVKKELTAYLKEVGITLKSIGWAASWSFDDDVQAGMNQKFIAKMVAGSLDTLRTNADINLKEGMAVGFRKGMPSFLAVPDTLISPLAAGAITKAIPPQTGK